MNFLSPFSLAFRFFNVIGTTILAAQVGFWCFKKYKELNNQRLRASQVREKFLYEFRLRFNRDPSQEEIDVALKAANAIDRPLQAKLQELSDYLFPKKQIDSGEIYDS